MLISNSEYEVMERLQNQNILSSKEIDGDTKELINHLLRYDLVDCRREGPTFVYTANAKTRALLKDHMEETEQRKREKAAQASAEKRDHKFQIVIAFLGAFFGALFGALLEVFISRIF